MISPSHMDEYAPAHFNAKTWAPVLVHSGGGGGDEEKSRAWRPYNIHVIVCIYLQLSEETLHFCVSQVILCPGSVQLGH